MKTILLTLAAVSLAATALHSSPVHASDWANAVDTCQGSLPSFEGALRKRPLGINNEGTANAFVSCSMRVPLNDDTVESILVLVTNRAAASADLACTLVDGLASPFGTATYQPKTTSVAAGAATVVSWSSSVDNGGDPYVIPNLNCALPPGMEINTLQVNTTVPPAP